ncbi:hypothetical protein DDZ18_05725 [Marinicauda salina]|uniref:TrkH family potassium uptake protein n=1 Tax=Marinicauda salina TaxID=2135793 RepID=A0A2U2BT66_9PROT|nr:potassium transporter TrkG [Marinicauda salina]PWE17193.1 hypothetical protein DDZ18_05725 [Marinicauda salina]
MRLSPRLFRALGWCFVILGASAAPFAGLAALEGAAAVSRGFAVTAALGLFTGGVALAGTQASRRAAGPHDAMRLVFYGWALTPLIAAPPLIAAAGSAAGGAFEAYSGLTTTGATVLVPEDMPRSIVLWRSLLQWLGGYASVIFAVTVFAALGSRGADLHRTSLLTVEGEDLFTNFGRAGRRIGGVYAGLTAVGWVAMLIAGVRPFDALCLALSGAATGGFAPQSGPVGEWAPFGGLVVLAALSLAGGWNIALEYELLSRRRMSRRIGELRGLLAAAGALAVTAWLVAGPAAIAGGFLDGVFAITTAGYASGGDVLPPVLLVLTALVGGGVISTAGGLKMSRVLLLARRAGADLNLLAHPSAAVRTRLGGRATTSEALVSVWVYALAFPATLALGAIAAGIAGADFADGWLMTGAALANAGPLAAVDYSAQPAGVLAVLSVVMVLGRLEVLAAAAAVFAVFAPE